MRIVVVSSTFPFGTQEAFLAAELAGLVEAGHDVTVVPLFPRGQRRAGDVPGVRYASLGAGDWREGSAWRLGIRRAVVGRGTVTASRTLASGIRGWARDAGAEARAPALAGVLQRVRADHVHAYWATGAAVAVAGASALTGVPWSFTAHRGDIKGNPTLASKAASATAVRFVSESWRQWAIERGVDPGKAHVIHVGVRMPPPRDDGGLPAAQPATGTWTSGGKPRGPDSFRILCPASLLPRKGQQTLLEAVALLTRRGREVEVTLAGDGPERSSLAESAAALGLTDRVRMPGHLQHAELLSAYERGEVDLVVLPSFSEGIPVSLMEAMARSVAVVSTTVDGIPELVPAGLGLLVEPGSAAELAEAIDVLLRDPQRRAVVARAGRDRVAAEFDAAVLGRRLGEMMADGGLMDGDSREAGGRQLHGDSQEQGG